MKKLLIVPVAFAALVSYSTTALCDTESTGTTLAQVMAVAPIAHSLYHDDGDGALQYGTGAVTTQLMTSLVKRSVHKERPNGNCCNSFPSSHASAAFHSAFYIAERYSYTEALPYFAGAAYVGYSRVHADKHDVVDILGGAGLAFLSNHYFTGTEESNGKPRIGFYTPDNGTGLMFVFDWRW